MRLILAAVVSLAALGSVSAQERANPPQTGSAAATAVGQEDLADIMHVTQLRHLKLSYAGSVRNWDLAEYEARQMGKSFRRAAQFYPVVENVPLASLIAAFSEPALAEVEKAIKERDGAAFFKSFKRLTAACNSCHQEAGRGFIRIRAPTASPFSNQVFPPAKN
jgi:mono/diheme cytochrome c family protein